MMMDERAPASFAGAPSSPVHDGGLARVSAGTTRGVLSDDAQGLASRAGRDEQGFDPGSSRSPGVGIDDEGLSRMQVSRARQHDEEERLHALAR